MTTQRAAVPRNRDGASRASCAEEPPARLRAAALNGAGVLVAVVTLAPIVWMISTAFKPRAEIFSLTPHSCPPTRPWPTSARVFSGSADRHLVLDVLRGTACS